MIYQAHGMKLNSVRIVMRSSVSDILVCKAVDSGAGNLYTLLKIKDHIIVKQLLEILENDTKNQGYSYIDIFSHEGCFCMIFPYRNERILTSFYMGEVYSLTKCEDICINLILACITEQLPYPILYLVLKQNLINLSKSDDVYFNYMIDFRDLNNSICEKDCVVQCAIILLKLLESKADQKAVSYLLLKKKIAQNSYNEFTELYRDVRIASVPKNRKGLLAAIRVWFKANRDTLFKILLWISVILAIIVVLTFVSQVIFGDISWLRFLSKPFKIIGTENLTR